jgi:hypothetical protein
LVNDARRRLRRCFAARTPQPSTTVAANDAASSNDVCRSDAAGTNDGRRKKCRNSQRPANDGPLNVHRLPQTHPEKTGF